MATIITPTERKFPLPVFIDFGQLKLLDEIVDRYRERLRAENERLLDAGTNSRFEEYYEKPGMTEADVKATKARIRERLIDDGWKAESKTVTVNLSHGRQLEVQNFTETLEHATLDEEIPTGFQFSYRLKPSKIRVTLNSSWTEELSIVTEPNDSELAQAIFGSLSNWAKDVAAPVWQQRWYQARWIFGFLFWVCLVLGGPIAYFGVTSQSAHKAEARNLLDRGIDAGNEKQAIALLLAIASEYHAGSETVMPARRRWFYFGLITVTLLLLCACPSLAIGLLRGKMYVTVFRWWTRFIFISIPLFVFGAFFRPWIVNWLSRLP